MYALFAAITKNGALKPALDKVNGMTVVESNMSTMSGLPYWVLVLILSALTLFFVIKTLRKPKVAVPKLKQKFTGARHLFFEKKYHPFFAAVFGRTYCACCVADELLNRS